MTEPRPRKRTTLLVIGVAFLGVAFLGYLAVATDDGSGAVRVGRDASPGVTPNDDTITVEGERLAYLAGSVEIVDLVVGPDSAPGEDGGDGKRVAGLLSVSGKIVNHGNRGIMNVTLVINLEDASKSVIGSYVEDVLRGKRLGPAESRSFRFTVPHKPEYAGHFFYKLR